MELTPEIFEKAEFTERRRGGYDIDQVETFLEDTGTAFARMLVKFERGEKELSAAEAKVSALEGEAAALRAKLGDAEDRLARAQHDSGAVIATPAASVAAKPAAEDDINSVARALVLAQEAADQTLRDARSEARTITDTANLKSQRQLADTMSKIDAMIADAHSRAEREFAERRSEVIIQIAELEDRRSALGDIVSQLETRITGYRQDLRRAAEELVSIADDPALMGPRDEQGSSDHDSGGEDLAATHGAATGNDLVDGKGAVTTDEPHEVPSVGADSESVSQTGADSEPDNSEPDNTDPTISDSENIKDSGHTEALEATGDSPAKQATVEASAEVVNSDDDPDEETHSGADDFLDLRTTGEVTSVDDVEGDSEDEWGPGSWSRVVGSLGSDGVSESVDGGSVSHAGTITATASTTANQVVKPQSQVAKPQSPQDGARSEQSEVVTTSKSAGESEGHKVVSGRTKVDDPDATQALDKVELIRDRYLEELDQAVNTELDAEDEALAAFLEGSSDSRSRRFGWRR